MAGCGLPPNAISAGDQPSDAARPIVIDAAFVPYLSKFVTDVGANVNGISVYFGTLPAPAVGRCTVYTNGDKAIIVDILYWSGASADIREELFYHEAAHCSMGLAHNDALDSRGCPISIMYHDVFGALACYGNNKAYYYNELKSHL